MAAEEDWKSLADAPCRPRAHRCQSRSRCDTGESVESKIFSLLIYAYVCVLSERQRERERERERIPSSLRTAH